MRTPGNMIRILSKSPHNRQQLHPSFSFINDPPPIRRDSHQSQPSLTTNILGPSSIQQRNWAFPQNSTAQSFSTSIKRAMAAETAVKDFFTSPHFAVVGASSDPQKFGHKSSFNSSYYQEFANLQESVLVENYQYENLGWSLSSRVIRDFWRFLKKPYDNQKLLTNVLQLIITYDSLITTY